MTVYPEEPTRHCDILMKGGITSGVIYPLAVCELAKQYGLRSVGGSSASAVAAAAAAAAESNPSRQAGFTRLEELPDDITEELPDGTAVLARLPAPTVDGPAVQGVHRRAGSVRDGPDAGDGVGCADRVLSECAHRRDPRRRTAGPWNRRGRLARWAAIIAAVVVLLAGAAAGVVVGVLRSLAVRVPANGFGLCSGMPALPRRDPRR